MPVVKQEVWPSSHACRISASISGGQTCGYTHGVMAVETMLCPLRNARDMLSMFSSAYCAVGPKYATVPSVPNAASISVVAASPVG
ncbi:Uncharacterised protein [Mycobacteroides abscessus]|nr:Uncharacterised protein [Mycobacteroides abscessus]